MALDVAYCGGYIQKCIYGLGKTKSERTATPRTVTQISLPVDARALSTLPRIDYHDAFRVDSNIEHDGEQWARAVLEDTPLAVRARLLSGWAALGLRLGPPWSERRVLGWRIERRTPAFVLLGARSGLGLRGELLFRREPHGLLFATLIQQSNPAARAVWAAITTTHQEVVDSLLTHAARREAAVPRRGAQLPLSL